MASLQLAPQLEVAHTFCVVVVDGVVGGGAGVGHEVWKHVTEGGVIHWQIGTPQGSWSESGISLFNVEFKLRFHLLFCLYFFTVAPTRRISFPKLHDSIPSSFNCSIVGSFPHTERHSDSDRKLFRLPRHPPQTKGLAQLQDESQWKRRK